MNFLIFVLLTVGICCNKMQCETATTIEHPKMVRKSLGMSIAKNIEKHTLEKQFSRNDTLLRQNSPKMQELKRITNTKVDSSNRKSKILGSLAFLTGLNAGSGLASVASSNVKAYTKLPLVALNFDASRVSPPIATIYDPRPYVPHPYIFATPLGFYPLWNPMRLHSISGMQNNFQSPTQNSQAFNLLDNNKPTDDLLNNNDEYVEEAKKVENVKPTSDVDEDTDEDAELQVEDDRDVEEKISTSEATCGVQKRISTKQANSAKSISKGRERADGSLMTSELQTAKVTEENTVANISHKNKTHIHSEVSQNKTNTTTATSVMPDSMDNNNHTNPPFYGYYGGYPQNINHIELTTETNEYKYHDYEHINYNLQSYDKPTNFYSGDRYNYYSFSPADSYPSNQFHQEQIPEYFSNDFKGYLSTSDSTLPFANSHFRPAV